MTHAGVDPEHTSTGVYRMYPYLNCQLVIINYLLCNRPFLNLSGIESDNL